MKIGELRDYKRKISNTDKGDDSNSSRIDFLANRVAETVRAEVCKFFVG